MGIPLDKIAAPSAHVAWDPDVGDTISGVITFAKIMTPKANFDGNALEQELRVDVVDEDGEQQTIWAVVNTDIEGDGYPSRLARAISSAVADDGASELEEGGKLAGVRVEDIPPAKKGRSPAHDFDFAYNKPSAKVKLALAAEPEEDGDWLSEEAEPARPPKRKAPSAKDLLG